MQQAWSPEGFDDYRALFPATPALVPEPDRALTQRFCERWRTWGAGDDDALRALAPSVTVVLVKGYLGDWMPGNFRGPRRALAALGFDAVLAANATGDTVEANAARLIRQLADRRSRERLVLCGHSKGGLEALWALADAPALAARCAGVLLAQTTRGPSRVLESLLLRRHQESLTRPHRRFAEALQRRGLDLIGAGAGGMQLTAERLAALLARIDAAPPPRRLIQTASWSTTPTTWLDSFHQRLGEVRPGCAHDGQFYLEDLMWPGAEHVLLPRLDHAQPAMGGQGFDPGRYWKVLLSELLRG
jgi:pimeloyl-ACP methyl ester carboxylesterase